MFYTSQVAWDFWTIDNIIIHGLFKSWFWAKYCRLRGIPLLFITSWGNSQTAGERSLYFAQVIFSGLKTQFWYEQFTRDFLLQKIPIFLTIKPQIYGIFTYLSPKSIVNVGKYSSPMEHKGTKVTEGTGSLHEFFQDTLTQRDGSSIYHVQSIWMTEIKHNRGMRGWQLHWAGMIYDHKPSRSRQGVSHKPLVSDQKITLKLFHAVMPAKNGFGVSLPFQLLCIPCDFAQSGISRLWIYGTFSSIIFCCFGCCDG